MSLEIKGGSDSAEQNKFFILTTVDLLAFPTISGIYSWALYKLYLNWILIIKISKIVIIIIN